MLGDSDVVRSLLMIISGSRSYGCFQLLRRRSGGDGLYDDRFGCRRIFLLRSALGRLLLHAIAFRHFDRTVRQIKQCFRTLQTILVFDHFLLLVRRRFALLDRLTGRVRLDRRFDHNVLLDRRRIGGDGYNSIIAHGLNVAAADYQVRLADHLATIYKDWLPGNAGQRGSRYGDHFVYRFDGRTAIKIIVIGWRIAD